MHIDQQTLIEVGLNAAGYLTAALLTLLIYAGYINRKYRSILKAVQQTSAGASSGMPATLAQRPVQHKAPEVVSLGGQSADAVTAVRTGTYDSYDEPSGKTQYTRNRAEVIRLARKMLEAGNSAERVADLLPVTESEMRLITLGVQRDAEA